MLVPEWDSEEEALVAKKQRTAEETAMMLAKMKQEAPARVGDLSVEMSLAGELHLAQAMEVAPQVLAAE